jgi:dTDP-4-dehydrorhamnose 3,5-epimerase
MEFFATAIPDVVLIRPKIYRDQRGFFMETWQRRTFADRGIDADFVQDNYSFSVQGTLRGLHYQLEHPQGKLVRVSEGEVFDVAVDIRRTSPTFGRWVGLQLSAATGEMLWIPPGFAHGFYVVSKVAAFHYKCTEYYVADDERGIRWDDPTIAIKWPLVPGVELLVSTKDLAARRIDTADTFP